MKTWKLKSVLCLCMAWTVAVHAQPRVFTASDFDARIQSVNRPRLAVAPDGGFALAFEAFVPALGGNSAAWRVLVQRFAASGSPLGPTHYFEGESCAGDISVWLSDYVEHVELAFRRDGILVVVLEHEGEYQLGGDGVQSAETTIAALDADGQLIDLNSASNCVQKREIFVGGKRQDRPRVALTPDGSMLLTMDGFFGGTFFRNVGIRILSGDLDELFEEVIPHDDPNSEQSLHMVPDVATNGVLILSAWYECPFVDNQGNISTCDIVAQFATATADGTLQGVGGNQRVNTGDPAGTEQFNASVAMNPAGQSVIVWRDYRTGPQGDVFAQRFDASGQPVGSNIPVSAGDGEIYHRPEVEMLDDGRFMVVWTDSSSVGFRGRGRRFEADGTSQGGPFVLVEGNGVESGQPALAAAGTTWQYALLAEQGNDIVLVMNDATTVGVAVADAEVLPSTFALHANYPNPFNPATTIAYDLPRASQVRLAVYDMLGREVARLVDGLRAAGRHAVGFEAGDLASGVYLYRLEAGAWSQSKQLILFK